MQLRSQRIITITIDWGFSGVRYCVKVFSLKIPFNCGSQPPRGLPNTPYLLVHHPYIFPVTLNQRWLLWPIENYRNKGLWLLRLDVIKDITTSNMTSWITCLGSQYYVKWTLTQPCGDAHIARNPCASLVTGPPWSLSHQDFESSSWSPRHPRTEESHCPWALSEFLTLRIYEIIVLFFF